MRDKRGRGQAELLCYLAREVIRIAGGADNLKTLEEQDTAVYLLSCYCERIQQVASRNSGRLSAHALAELQGTTGRIAEFVRGYSPGQSFSAVAENAAALLKQTEKLREE